MVNDNSGSVLAGDDTATTDLDEYAGELGWESFTDALLHLADKFGYATFDDLAIAIEHEGHWEFLDQMTDAEFAIWVQDN